MAVAESLSLKEELVELSLDIDAILTETIAAFVDCAKKRTVDDNLANLTNLFTNRCDTFKKLVRNVNTRTDADTKLEKLNLKVKRQDDLITAQAEKLTDALRVTAQSRFMAQKVLKRAQTQAGTFDPEEVIRFSHLISKNFSVASPHFWQQGDPMRPFPTELHFRASTLGNTEGIKDPKELSIIPSTFDLSNDEIPGVNGNDVKNFENPPMGVYNDMEVDNDQDDYDDVFKSRVELVLPSSTTKPPPPVTHNSTLMSSDEDDSDDD